VTAPLRILVLEDSESDFVLITRELKRGFATVEVQRVDDPPSLGMALQESWDLIISDWSMPRLSALEALGMLGDLDLDVPFIIVSGTIGEETAVEAMRSGAKDYLLKDRLARLVPVVQRELQEARERREHRQAEETLRAAEARYRLLFNQGPLPELLYDAENLRLLAVNDAAAGLYGYSREELSEMTFADLRGSRDVGTPGVAHHRRKDGTSVDVECTTRDVILEDHPCRLSVCRQIR
jgi:two-component system cell cycle sensor histidine kinase/response regulator CckA